jgi:hypothetical protein
MGLNRPSKKEDSLHSKTWLIQNSKDQKKVFWIMKNIYNSNKKSSWQFTEKISTAPISAICGRLSRHHYHELSLHMV